MTAIKKAKKKVNELPVDAQGRYIVTTAKHAMLALKKAAELIDTIDKIKIDNDLAGKEATYQDLRRALSMYQDANGIQELSTDGWKSLLVERSASQWIWDDTDLDNLMKTGALDQESDSMNQVKPLKRLLEDYFDGRPKKLASVIKTVTKQMVDREALDGLIKDGTLTLDLVSSAFVQYIQSTYVRIGRK